MVAVEAAVTFDYEHVVRAFTNKLLELRDHIREHQAHEGWERDVIEIEKGVEMVLAATDEPSLDDVPWNEAWDYIRDNMRGWWC